MARAVLFVDIDGTLVQASSSQFLARRLGHSRMLAPAEKAYAAGNLDNDEVATIDARGYSGHREQLVQGWLSDLPVVAGVSELVSWCRSVDVIPVLATLAWSQVGDHLVERFGFDGACGPRLEVVAGTYTGRVASHFDELGKLEFARTTAESFGIALDACAAVGDSRSDLPLFGAVGLAVAFNASFAAQQAAHVIIGGPDITAIIPSIEGWL